MLAIRVHEFGGPDVLRMEDVARPEPGPEEILVRVMAAGVGPWDIGLREGRFGGSLPYIPGGEFAGVVAGPSGEFADFDDGTPVYGYPALTGCYAQYVTCPVEQLAPIPSGLSMADAGTVPINAMTAEQGLTDELNVAAGDTVLITAAAGGLGHLAVQIARALGANVIATASPDNHQFLHHLGAEIVIDHTQPDWPEQVRKVTDGGAAKVLAVAIPSLAGAAQAARHGAVIATAVTGTGDYPDADRVTWRHYNGEMSGTRLIRLAPWFDDGTLSVEVSGRYSWQDAAEAQRQVARGHTRGKIGLVVDDDLAAELEV
ncbi:MAG TPA: NADP-dependent oxidoreductase [Streptosporangiaceae bacterium]|jgi:NADPH:quinone reductase-like Zn-dependent oxidoreductase|nr:NADP-dependent oxidoreductase [Streptosporangiaceae bacterium]